MAAIYKLCGDLSIFIRAARIADWELHLFSTSEILNLLAATGHVHYAKCSRIYLQMMVNLEQTNPWLYQRFAVEGLFVVRRNKRFRASLWPDLSIEQIMMRALEGRGGLTHGSSFTESVQMLWIYSMHLTASYHNALSHSTQTQHKTSDQYEKLSQSRKLRDFNNLKKLITWFQYQSHNSFNPDRHQLQALDSGLIADQSVNYDEAKCAGRSIQDSLDGVSLKEATIKQSAQVTTLSSLKPSVKIGNEKVVIDPIILFSPLVVLLQKHDDITRFFAYELPCSKTI